MPKKLGLRITQSITMNKKIKLHFQEFGKFVKLESTPLVLEFSQAAAPQIFGSDIKVHFLLFLSKSDKEVSSVRVAVAGRLR